MSYYSSKLLGISILAQYFMQSLEEEMIHFTFDIQVLCSSTKATTHKPTLRRTTWALGWTS
jgi:hypothetical protein